MMGKMLTYGLYLLLTLGCFFESYNFSEYDIPDEIYQICSYANICHRKATSQPPVGYTSCCQSCSCEEDCGLTLNCCFDHLDKYRRVEKGEVSCIKPTIGRKTRPNQYYMISSCNLINEVLQKANTSACQLQDENGTNLLSPVSSANGIYVSAKCAECNYDFNYTTWDYVHYAERFIESEHTNWSFENNAIGESGTVEYIPPRSNKWSAPTLCYHSNLPPYCSDNEVLTFPLTCKNLQSIFIDGEKNTIYKNAACILCNASSLHEERQQVCPKVTGFSSHGTITKLIDSRILNALDFNKVFKSNTDVPSTKMCRNGNIKSILTGRCLSVHCPEGLIRTKSGCKYLFKRWYAKGIIMQLKLSADDRTSLPVKTIQKLPSRYLFNPKLWMKPSCPGMTPIAIYYEHENLTHVNSFIVVIVKEIYNGRGFSPPQMYPILRSCLEKPWTVLIMSVTYTFTVKLDRYIGYVQDGIRSLHYVSDAFMRRDPLPKLYDKIIDVRFAKQYRHLGMLVVQKTFFCNQIRLPEEEVELGYGEIRILANNKTLGTNEFIYSGGNRQDVWTNFTCNICLEDYMPQNGSSSSNYVWNWFVVCKSLLQVVFCTQYMLAMKQ